MIQAWSAKGGKWIAAYRVGTDTPHYFRMALNARGEPILCDTEELALSVARARLARIAWRP